MRKPVCQGEAVTIVHDEGTRLPRLEHAHVVKVGLDWSAKHFSYALPGDSAVRQPARHLEREGVTWCRGHIDLKGYAAIELLIANAELLRSAKTLPGTPPLQN